MCIKGSRVAQNWVAATARAPAVKAAARVLAPVAYLEPLPALSALIAGSKYPEAVNLAKVSFEYFGHGVHPE